ncbi:hypothetical protein [Brevundimonas naejangsanensis]|uniref:hypothetical protein n=1 Tax=Brevundimonas naejangsanensis TaxID=588932 RepID=UPI001069B485|nr:hypothetical protein [Brevundimonas naejangsanensis]QBQ49077.1 hypothetical protein E3U41_10515 [Brevundimonas naejangsanensis]
MQAALNILREQRRAVLDVHRQLLRDHALEAEDPAHRRQLLAQTLTEQRELSVALSLIERVMDGRLVEIAGEPRPAPIGAWAETTPGRLVSREAGA